MVEKCSIDGRIYDITPFNEFARRPQDYATFGAIHEGDYIYPIRGRSDNRPGVYDYDTFGIFKEPVTEEDKERYSDSHIINFSDSKSIREIMEKQDAINASERGALITRSDNVFVCNIGHNDEPLMKAVKSAINSKGIEWENYNSRFGDNTNNDRRLLNGPKITINKAISICKNMDLEISVTIRDASPDVPNPMGKEISVVLTGGSNDESVSDAT